MRNGTIQSDVSVVHLPRRGDIPEIRKGLETLDVLR